MRTRSAGQSSPLLDPVALAGVPRVAAGPLQRLVLGGAVIASGALAPGSAEAAIRMAEPGVFQGAVPPAAQARAEGWAVALGGDLVQVEGSPGADDFTETVAIVERPGAIPDFDDPAALLEAVVGPMLPPSHTLTAVVAEPTAGFVRGRFGADGIAYHVAVASSGARHGVFAFAVRAAEESVYRDRVEEAYASLEGFAPAVRPFPTGRWLAASWTALAGLTALAWLLLARRGLAGLSRVAWAAVSLAGLSVLAGAVVWGMAVRQPLAPLTLADVTPAGLGAQVAGLGLAAAGAGLAAAWWWARSPAPVQSAPTSGVFAERRAPAAPEPRRSDPSPPAGHPDGPSVLEDARRTLGRPPETR